MHHHRAEHWIVVKGTARVTLDGQQRLLTENESIYRQWDRSTRSRTRARSRSR